MALHEKVVLLGLLDLREWLEGQEVNWVRVKSKMLAAVAYNPDWRHLYLEFRSGDIYCYRGVPAERYEELLAADSKGQYCRQHILQHFPYDRIPRTFRSAS